MTTNKGIAEEIINEGVDPDEEEEEEGEEVSLEEELDGLKDSIETMQARFGKAATKLRAKGKVPATAADLAELYEDLKTDLLEVMKDTVEAVSAGFQELASDDEEEGEGDGEEEPLDDNTVQVYTTLVMNVELYKKLTEDMSVSQMVRDTAVTMCKINEDGLRIFEEQYDIAELQKLAQERMAEANGKS